MSNNIAPVIEELRKAYKQLKPMFDSTFGATVVYDDNTRRYVNVHNPTVDMPMPVITVQRRGRSKADGWYKRQAWHSDSAEAMNVLAGAGRDGQTKVTSTDEIGIVAETLNRPTSEILLTLIGQMVHHYAAYNGGQTQNEYGYQNQRYHDLCERVGIQTERMTGRGYEVIGKVTEHHPRFDQITQALAKVKVNEDIFDLYRNENLGKEVKKGSKLKKWSCQCTNIRVATHVNAVCQKCGEQFVYTDKDKDEIHIREWLRQMGTPLPSIG